MTINEQKNLVPWDEFGKIIPGKLYEIKSRWNLIPHSLELATNFNLVLKSQTVYPGLVLGEHAISKNLKFEQDLSKWYVLINKTTYLVFGYEIKDRIL